MNSTTGRMMIPNRAKVLPNPDPWPTSARATIAPESAERYMPARANISFQAIERVASRLQCSVARICSRRAGGTSPPTPGPARQSDRRLRRSLGHRHGTHSLEGHRRLPFPRRAVVGTRAYADARPRDGCARLTQPLTPRTARRPAVTETLIPAIDETKAEIERLRLRTQLFIDGDFRDALGGGRFVTENPATGRPIAEVAAGRPGGRRPRRRGGAPGRRRRPLVAPQPRRTASGSSSAGPTSSRPTRRELGIIETIDAGKPITDTVGLDMPETAACIRWHAEAIDKLYGQVAPSPEGTVATITREPVGVVGAVIPWNYPAQMAAWKLGPGARDRQHRRHQARLDDLAEPPADRRAGRRGRASPTASSTSSPGPGDVVGEAIGRHPDVDCVAFTGSTEVGPPVPPLRGRDQPQARAARARRQEPAARVRRRRGPRPRSPRTSRSRSSGTWARTARPGRG